MRKSSNGTNSDVMVSYSDRVKITIEQWPSGKLHWEISVAGDNARDTLDQIYAIETEIKSKY